MSIPTAKSLLDLKGLIQGGVPLLELAKSADPNLSSPVAQPIASLSLRLH